MIETKLSSHEQSTNPSFMKDGLGITNKLIQYKQKIYQNIYQPTIQCNYFIDLLGKTKKFESFIPELDEHQPKLQKGKNIRLGKNIRSTRQNPMVFEQEQFNNPMYSQEMVTNDIPNYDNKEKIKDSIMKNLMKIRAKNSIPKLNKKVKKFTSNNKKSSKEVTNIKLMPI